MVFNCCPDVYDPTQDTCIPEDEAGDLCSENDEGCSDLPTTTTMTPPPTPECAYPDFAYAGANILTSGSFNLKDNAEDCQRSCQAITGCLYWTWYSPDVEDSAVHNFCNLHYEIQGTIFEEGTLSGPKNCDDL